MIGVISDIHGNYEALKVVLQYFEENDITKIFCLGDVVGYYPQINECCDALRERNAVCLMGNHDWYMTAGSRCLRSKSVNDCLRYQRTVISETNKKWLGKALLYYTDGEYNMVHGGWADPVDEYLVPDESYFEGMKPGLYFSGHTHRQGLYRYRQVVYCNPGAVGQPRDGDNRAAFAVVEGGQVFLKRLPYPIEKVGRLMEQCGLSAYYYDCLRVGGSHLGYYTGENNETGKK